MSYLVLARKFRPQCFAEVAGQEHVTRTLSNSIKRDKVGHAYLFAGPRGVGKTSIARIFAKSLNCTKGPSLEPCLKCSNCMEITQGSNMAVREIDGASHSSVDNVRDLIDSFRALPAPGSRYKIYIIDEVHMLSGSAFNALLKSLEEPPPHTVFILATTEAHKIPETVISRCQRHDFRALTFEQIEERIAKVAEAEKMQVEPEVLRMIARLSDGSMRDAESLLERVWAFCDGPITAKETSKVLGTVERTVLFALSQAIFSKQVNAALGVLQEAFARGIDPVIFLKEFASHWREILIARFSSEIELKKIGLSTQEINELQNQVQSISTTDVQDLVQLAREGADRALWSRYPRYVLESVIVRMATREPVQDLGALIGEIKKGLSTTASSGLASRSPQVANKPRSVSVEVPRGASVRVEQARAEASGLVAQITKTKGAESLDWGAFVYEAGKKHSKMLAEQLKRLGVDEFSAGTLVARGPEFSVACILEKENRKKLEVALSDFSGVGEWNVRIVGVDAGSNVGSLHASEAQTRAENGRKKKADLANHPKLKSLQKAFPGSSIEEIKIKESD